MFLTEKHKDANPLFFFCFTPSRRGRSYVSSVRLTLLHMSLAASDPYVEVFASGCTLSVCLLPVNMDSRAHYIDPAAKAAHISSQINPRSLPVDLYCQCQPINPPSSILIGEHVTQFESRFQTYQVSYPSR